jgi:hypothetical protein
MATQPTSWLQNLGIAIEIICPGLALIFVGLRLYIRIKLDNFGWGMSSPHDVATVTC